MLELKLEQPKTEDDKEMLAKLESLALECSLHISPTVRHDYDMTVNRWINDFKEPLAFRRQRYLSHYLKKKYEYLGAKKL